jgi:hypothetical protein
MVEYTDPETGETIKTLVDKVRKKKITPLKRAIMLKRERMNHDRKAAKAEDSFETIEEFDEDQYDE